MSKEREHFIPEKKHLKIQKNCKECEKEYLQILHLMCLTCGYVQ